jgi:peptide/nickel transport system permease protein
MNYGYILQRLALAIVVILGVTFVVFMIMQIVPGDPARVVLGPYASDESVAGLRERLGLNQPFFVQYLTWLGKLFQGNFGDSLLTGQSVSAQLIGRLGPTLELTLASMLIGTIVAFPVGIISAIRPGSKIDIFASLFSQVGVSIPSFWFGIMLVLLFSLQLNLLPPSGYVPISENLIEWLRHLVLPALTAGLVSASIQTRFIRSAMLDVLSMNYVQTARAKGLSERKVIINHALRNAMINIVTILGLQITALFGGVVIVEIVFAWPGLGRLALNAVLERDYPVLQGTVFAVAAMVTLVNLIVDLLYFVLDPRIEYA